jgi:hypothetical protein
MGSLICVWLNGDYQQNLQSSESSVQNRTGKQSQDLLYLRRERHKAPKVFFRGQPVN